MFPLLKRIAAHAASASRMGTVALLNPAAGQANGLHRLAF
jgi:hypothetical protein